MQPLNIPGQKNPEQQNPNVNPSQNPSKNPSTGMPGKDKSAGKGKWNQSLNK